MSGKERKFRQSLQPVGAARQVRLAVSQAVKETSPVEGHFGDELGDANQPVKSFLIDSLDYESYITKYRTVFENDPCRDLILFPRDDVTEQILPHEWRTVFSSTPSNAQEDCDWLLAKSCLRLYNQEWHLIIFNYRRFAFDQIAHVSGSSKIASCSLSANQMELRDLNVEMPIYEIDFDLNSPDDMILHNSQIQPLHSSAQKSGETVIKEGSLMMGPDFGQESSINFRALKKRYCYLRKEVDGSFKFDYYKEKTKSDALKGSIYLEFCTEITRHHCAKGSNRNVIRIRLSEGSPGAYLLSAENSDVCEQWLDVLHNAYYQVNKRLKAVNAATIEDSQSIASVESINTHQLNAKESSLERDLAIVPNRLQKYLFNEQLDIQETSDKPISVNFFDHCEECNSTDSKNILNENVLTVFSVLDKDKASYASHNVRFAPDTLLKSPTGSLKSSGSSSIGYLSLDSSSSFRPFSDIVGVRFLVEVKLMDLKLLCGSDTVPRQIEPFFVRFALFDLRESRKISEDFFVDMNPFDIKDLMPKVEASGKDLPNLKGISEAQLLDTPISRAIFQVNRPHPDIFLVVRIEKIFQGSILSGLEPYLLKPNENASRKSASKLQQSIAYFCENLTQYRQPFAWGAKPVFAQLMGVSPLSNSEPDSLQLYKQDAQKLSDVDICKYLNEMTRTSDFKMPAKSTQALFTANSSVKVKVDVAFKPESIDNLITSSLMPVKKQLESENVNVETTREIQSFCSASVEDVAPFGDYENRLYINPLALRYENAQKIFPKARNLTIKIELRDSDDFEVAKPLQCIYAQTGIDRNKVFVAHSFTAITHHETNPQFYEEWKLELPLNLTDKHHILFTIYHVGVAQVSNLAASASGKKKKDTSSAHSAEPVVVGYAWLPLMKNGRVTLSNNQPTLASASVISSENSDVNSSSSSIGSHLISLPVVANLQHSGYLACESLGLGKGFAGPELKWIDGGKPIFQISARLVSTVYSCNQSLQNFFLQCQRLKERGTSGDNGSPEKLRSLHTLDPITMIQFLPVLLDQLLYLLTLSNCQSDQLNIMRCLLHILHESFEAQKWEFVQSYVKFVLVAPQNNPGDRTLHDELCQILVACFRPTNVDPSTTKQILRFFRFFAEVIVKSAAQRLMQNGRIKMARTERFSSDFQFRLEQLVHTFATVITQNLRQMKDETDIANQTLALFLRECISLMNRGFVFQLMQHYIQKLDNLQSKQAQEYKLTFVQTVCSHEHFLPLNLPILCSKDGAPLRKDSLTPSSTSSSLATPVAGSEKEIPLTTSGSGSSIWQKVLNFGAGIINNAASSLMNSSMSSSADTLVFGSLRADPLRDYSAELVLCDAYYKRHWLLGIVFQFLNRSFYQASDPMRQKWVGLFKFLLYKLSEDVRYQNMAEQSRIASLCFPIVELVMQNIDSMEDDQISDCRGNSLDKKSSIAYANSLERPSSMIVHSNGTVDDNSDTMFNYNEASWQSKHSTTSQVLAQTLPAALLSGISSFSERECRQLLLSCVFVLNAVDDSVLRFWWYHGCHIDNRMLTFLKLLELATEKFVYLGKQKLSLRSAAASKPVVTTSTMSTKSRQQRMSSVSSVSTAAANQLESNKQELPSIEIRAHAKLAQEVALIVLRLCSKLCEYSCDFWCKSRNENIVMHRTVEIVLKLLGSQWSQNVQLQALAFLRQFVRVFWSCLFRSKTSVMCKDMCRALLRSCNSALEPVQSHACLLLYTLMRCNFQATGRRNFIRVHLQVVISLSELLGDQSSARFIQTARMQQALSLINSLASADKQYRHTGFCLEVRDVIRRLRTVLMASSGIKDHQDDPEKLADLQKAIADSYVTAPHLRKCWLESLCKLHKRNSLWTEAAMCQMHISAMIAEYLKRTEKFAFGCEIFASLSANIVDAESAMKIDNLTMPALALDGSEQSAARFSLDGMIEAVEECAGLCVNAERYELLGALYRPLLPLYEQRRDYKALENAYGRLALAYNRVVDVIQSGKRMLATYFRVAFFGPNVFAEDHSVEYIYKEPKVTALSEISNRLLTMYALKYGKDRVKLINDSKPFIFDQFDQSIGYIQITHVEPYSPEVEKSYVTISDNNSYERHANVCCFFYDTPFTQDGGAQGKSEDQWKRRTILYSQAVFPYVVKRVVVVKRDQADLDPLQVATEEIKCRTRQLAQLISKETCDLKKLQLTLQGSVQVTVNAGPLSYAETFIANAAQRAKYSVERVEELKNQFRSFVDVSSKALQLNATLISAEQFEYHQALCENFRIMLEKLQEIFGEPILLTSDVDASSCYGDRLSMYERISQVS